MATIKKGRGKGLAADVATTLAAGTAKHIATGAPMVFAGGSFTPDQVVAKLQALVKFRDDVESAKAATQAKVATEKANAPALRDFMAAYAAFLMVTFGTAPDVLVDFGLRPKKAATPQTTEAKAVAAAKRASTRAARHTMGSRQRKSVVGNVVGMTLVPITAAPIAPSPSSVSPSPSGAGTAAAPSGGTTPHTP